MNNSYKIHCGNCIDLFKTMKDNSVDLVVTDPPYRVISGGRPKIKGQPSGILKKNDGKIFKYNDIKPEEWIPEVYRILKDNSQCYIMVNTINMENYLRICREVGFGLHNILTWEKSNCTPSRWYMKNAEFILFLRKGKAKTINNVGSKMCHSFKNIVGNKKHPTEKPVELMELYVENSSNEGDIIFDPFMGSGSTGVAALKNNRKFVGIEIDREYYNVAEKRLEEYERKEEDN